MTRIAGIGISGSAGTGKSTLGTGLADRLDLPYQPEGMRERLENGLDLHCLAHLELRALLLELFEQMVSAIRSRRQGGTGFVCDRSPVDYAAFWLYYGFGADEAATRDFMAAAEKATDHFDFVILLPWGQLPLVEDGVRSANPWRQLHFQAILEGLAHRGFGTTRYHFLPTHVIGAEDRVAWTLDLLARDNGPPLR